MAARSTSPTSPGSDRIITRDNLGGEVGRTPIVKTTGARFSLNMISAVTAKGLLRFSTFTGSMTAEKFIDFCKRVLAATDGPVFLIVDGHPTHRSKKVKTFVTSANGALRLYRLFRPVVGVGARGE